MENVNEKPSSGSGINLAQLVASPPVAPSQQPKQQSVPSSATTSAISKSQIPISPPQVSFPPPPPIPPSGVGIPPQPHQQRVASTPLSPPMGSSIPQQQQLPQVSTIHVQVPTTLLPGRQMVVYLQQGPMHVVVPDGVMSGMVIPVQIPNTPAVAAASPNQHRRT